MVNHPGQPIKIQDIPELVGQAFPRAFTPVNIMKGFLSTGIYPFNSSVFTDLDFLGANVTDRPQPENILEQDLNSTPSIPTLATCSQSGNASEIKIVSPQDLRPFPKAGPRKTGRGGRRPCRSRVLTDTPIKMQIDYENKLREEKKNKKNESKMRKAKKELNLLYFNKPSSESEGSEFDDQNTCQESDDSLFEEIESNEETLKWDRHFEEGNYLLIKFSTKTTTVHYVGRIQSVIENEFEFRVQFLRKDGENFYYPEVDDISVVPESDIVRKMPNPTSSGGTQRAGLKLKFPGITFDRGMVVR